LNLPSIERKSERHSFEEPSKFQIGQSRGYADVNFLKRDNLIPIFILLLWRRFFEEIISNAKYFEALKIILFKTMPVITLRPALTQEKVNR